METRVSYSWTPWEGFRINLLRFPGLWLRQVRPRPLHLLTGALALPAALYPRPRPGKPPWFTSAVDLFALGFPCWVAGGRPGSALTF